MSYTSSKLGLRLFQPLIICKGTNTGLAFMIEAIRTVYYDSHVLFVWDIYPWISVSRLQHLFVNSQSILLC